MENAERWDAWFDAEPEVATEVVPGNDVTRLMASMWGTLVAGAMVLGLGLLVVVAIS